MSSAFVERSISSRFRDLFASYPVVTVTGPRQSGKTTLCRALFPELDYINLERPDIRESAAAAVARRLRELESDSEA
jgi:uncharacterized protein